MRTFSLIGQDIAFSASPAIHTAALRALGLDFTYGLTDIPVEELAATLDALRGTTNGVNVTIPHKAAALKLMDELDDSAEAARAVNTVVVDGNQLIGYNTDLPAIEEAISLLIPEGLEHAVILGYGGAARAVESALFRMDVAVTIAQRRDGSLDRVDEFLPHAQLVVNTTPVGTGTEATPIDVSNLRPELAVLDMIYRPSPTALVSAALEIGAPAAAGGGILVGQAWRSLKLWLESDGIEVGPSTVEVMTEALKTELGVESL